MTTPSAKEAIALAVRRMKLPSEVWSHNFTDRDGAEAADEIVEWDTTALLRDGVVRLFAEKLKADGFPEAQSLLIARSHIERMALLLLAERK